MNIKFDEKARKAFDELLLNSTNEYIRIKAVLGCGKPAYDIYADIKEEDDILEVIDGIKFVINKKTEKACNNIQITYDKEVYIRGFYIKSI